VHLHRLAQDRSLVRRMGDASRTRAGDFSWDRAALRYIDLLKQFTSVVPFASANLNVEAKH
jgi:glycosyltransferase involved in cell wall biosynthesis